MRKTVKKVPEIGIFWGPSRLNPMIAQGIWIFYTKNDGRSCGLWKKGF